MCVCGQWVPSDYLRPHGTVPTRLLCPWNFPGKNTGVNCHFLLQDLPDPGIELMSLASVALAGRLLPPGPFGKLPWALSIQVSYFFPLFGEGRGLVVPTHECGVGIPGPDLLSTGEHGPPEWPRSHPSGHKAVSGLVILVWVLYLSRGCTSAPPGPGVTEKHSFPLGRGWTVGVQSGGPCLVTHTGPGSDHLDSREWQGWGQSWLWACSWAEALRA